MTWEVDSLQGAKATVKSNGHVGMWGQSWSACNSFVVAGRKARDSRLNALKTIIPMHCAVNLYEGECMLLFQRVLC
jgi:hypothetical protein